MAKPVSTRAAPAYRCSECGWRSVQWLGRCAECQTWGTVDRVGPTPGATVALGSMTAPARPISEVVSTAAGMVASGVAELDRVLGGGLVGGAVVLLAGEPGVGKSTLLLEVCAMAARRGATTLYVSGEESVSQVRLRAERTGAVHDQILLASEVDLSAVLGHIDAVRPDVLVVDSVQTIASAELDGSAGGVTQVRAVTAALIRVAKERDLPTILVGHVTKDGTIAGPRALEHVVDVVLHFEGERNSRFRLLRAIKNRFGPVDEIGCFDISDRGIVEVADATGLFVAQHSEPMSGTCVTVTLEGRRPLLAEIQALVSPTTAPTPRRAVSGLDSARVAMVLAVLQRRIKLQVSLHDVYAATVGGAAVKSPAADLAIAFALAGSTLDAALPLGTVAIGEVGLAGELRRVPSLPQRLAEAARLGFRRAIVPVADGRAPTPLPSVDGLSVIESPDLRHALRMARVIGDLRDRPEADLHLVR